MDVTGIGMCILRLLFLAHWVSRRLFVSALRPFSSCEHPMPSCSQYLQDAVRLASPNQTTEIYGAFSTRCHGVLKIPFV